MAKTLTSPDAPSSAAETHGKAAHRDTVRGLLLVGLFKLSKALFFGAVGVTAFNLVHHNVGDLAMRLTSTLRLAPSGRLAGLLMDRADLIDNHHLRQAGMLALGYAVCCLVEGVGLIMQKVWAEYVTVVLTIAAMPYELYEIGKHASEFKVVLFLLNVAVLVYLLWLLRRKRGGRAAT